MILESAGREFLERGLFATSMGDVAIRACLTRRTLYRYFDSKEELAFEVACEIMHAWNLQQARMYRSLRGNGLKRLKGFLMKLTRYLSAHDEIMKFMGEFDFYFNDDSPFSPDQDVMLRYAALSRESDTMMGEILSSGIADGSMKPGIDVGMAVSSISNILWGFGQRLAARRRRLREEYKMDPIRLVYYQIELYVLALAS